MDSRFITKLKKVYAYLFEGFPFNVKTLNYDWYWEELEKRNNPAMAPSKLRFIGEIIDEGSTVLDIGCGDGTLLHYLQEAKGIRGKGIEVSEKAVELARGKGIDVEKADVTKEDFGITETYDYVIISEVLEHLPNSEELMLKVKDRFRKYLIVTIPNTGFVGERLRLLLGRFPKQWVLHPSEHLRFWTVRDFIFWCQQLGFRVESYSGLFDEYYDIKFPLWKWCPKLFSRYILYEVAKK